MSSEANYKVIDTYLKVAINDQATSKIEVFNVLKKGSLKIIKVDENSKEPLANVTFALFDHEKTLLGEYITDEEGKIIINDLPLGTYYLEEISNQANYEKLEGQIALEVKEDILSTIEVGNRLKIEVPKTGTNEFLITLILSALSLLLGALLCNYDQNK